MLNATGMTLQCVLLVGALFCGICQAVPPWAKESPYDNIQCPDEHYHYHVGLACCPCSQCPMHGAVDASVVMQCYHLYRKKLVGDPNKVCRTKNKSNCKSYDSILEEMARTTGSPVERTVPAITNTTKNPTTPSPLSESSPNLTSTPHSTAHPDKEEDTGSPGLIVLGALVPIFALIALAALVVAAIRFDCLKRTKRFSQRCGSDQQEHQPVQPPQTNRNDVCAVAVPQAPEIPTQAFQALPGVPKKEDGVGEIRSVHTGPCSDEKQRAVPIPRYPHHHTPRTTQRESPDEPQPVNRTLLGPPNQTPGSNVNISPSINAGPGSIIIVCQNSNNTTINGPPQPPFAPYASPANQHPPCPSCDRREGLPRRRPDDVINRQTFNMSNDYSSSSGVCRHPPDLSRLPNNHTSVAYPSRTFREHGTAERMRLLSSTTDNVRDGGRSGETDGRNSPGYDSQPLSMPYLPDRDLGSDEPRHPPS